MNPETPYKAGFVSIIGKPNAGKSTLMNQMVGEKLSVITAKAQTTRHRIMGILNGDNFQIVYSDTPGIIEDPKYKLHRSMIHFVYTALEDADIILFVTDINESFENTDFVDRVKAACVPVFVLINKTDTAEQAEVSRKIAYWQKMFEGEEVIPVSALHNFNVRKVLDRITETLPEHPPYFPEDELTDKSQRFFASEIIREKIFLYCKQEIPYSSEVLISRFKEDETIIRISAEIIVERDSQKPILIGKKGSMLKKIGSEARKDMEEFFGKQVFLEQFVKVAKDWRKDDRYLTKFGYKNN